ncbi:TIGR02302 family protein [Loktanella salsilacus]|uniref:TIGR02302 family protein n=2 Tax=Loktanella salsilacus TaxID=195913 RepID=A0A1I4HN80_9RHOB|nr:DUF4175 domain-containing protein [Loktanella salsilacus]SFL43177.1 TIGR02302 family protein [Loktanella salsilacus]
MGLVAERATRAFWPLWSVLFVILTPLMFGFQDRMSLEVFWGLSLIAALAVGAALVRGLRMFRWPSKDEALARVDAALPGRPISAVRDAQAIGASDPASAAVWQAHQARMRVATQSARAVQPDLRVSDRDPYGLRFMALLMFVVALLFGSVLRVGSVAQIAQNGGGAALATGPVWEGWITPPAYTGKPVLYLNDIAPGAVQVPLGSDITLRLYGEVGALSVTQTVSGDAAVPPATDPQQSFSVAQAGQITIDGPNGAAWDVGILADAAPYVTLTAPIESDAMGELNQAFAASDDYGVESGTATFALDLSAVDRSFGLTVDPDPIDPVVLDLPMPFSGDRSDFDEFLIDNLSQHELANLPVTLTLSVTDAAGQTASTPAEPMTLPGRRFFQPVAKAIVEQRRDLMWSRANARRIVQVLRAISYEPDTLFTNQATYLRLRFIIKRLDQFDRDGITDENEAEIVQALWDLAVQLEDGTLADARERLARAQERLEEAMRNGASEAEIAELMQELRDATQDYMQMLADQMEPGDGTDEPQSAENSTQMSQDELQALMDRIEELMQEGRMAEAQALMEQLNSLLENMRITQGEGSGDGPQTPGQQSMQDLADTLRDQQDLSDDAFRDMQNQGQQGQQGQQPGQEQGEGQQGQAPGQGQQPGADGSGEQPGQEQGQGDGEGQNDGQGSGAGENEGQSLAQRQQALRDELNRQRGALPGLPGDAGDQARRSLDSAEGAMDGAEQALRDGDMAQAIDRQADAMDALRDGMRAIGEALAQNESQEPGQGNATGDQTGQAQPGRRDPLGRQLGSTGQYGTEENLLQGEDTYRRAEELLEELRRRLAEQERPQVERDYLDRLLDRF